MFGTSGVRGLVGEAVTADLTLDVGRALATDGAETVVLGRDARDNGRMLVRALVAGLTECGADVIDVGVESTPTVARAVAREGADAGVVVTASHNPAPDNGIKLWTESGRAFGDERNDRITEIVKAESFDLAAADAIGAVEERDVVAGGDARRRHERALRESVPPPDDLSVVVDLGNGVGRVTADALHAAGCDVETLNAQRDGREGSLATLVDDLPDYPIRRDSIRTDAKRATVERVGEVAATEYDDVSTLDGIRVETDAGWFLVRASGTEPLVRITAEARDEADADALFETARGLVERADKTN